MNCFVENGLAGCRLAGERRAITVIVDALRAGAMLSSLFHYGTQQVLVVREIEEAFRERERRPAAALAGERGGPMVPGFDLGNSPLQAPPAVCIREVIFSSSNCSRCCVGVQGVPAALLGTTVNARAAATAVREAARRVDCEDLVFVTAGAAADEALLVIEDHLGAGAVMAALDALGQALHISNDRAEVCRLLFAEGEQATLMKRFRRAHNGSRLTALGLGADVEFASRLDVFDLVPQIVQWVGLESGGQGAVLEALRP